MGLGLKSAIYTASTGMKASEKTINVAGDNLANANTIGYKYDRADFVDFLSYTYRLGTSPGMGYTAGSNPTQIGMGVSLAGITTNFAQGGFKEGLTNSDIAINGNGFFIVQQPGKSVQAYTRNGALKVNSDLTLTTNTGEYVLGYPINDNFQIQYGTLSQLRIPIGEMHIAQQTTTVSLEGVLNAVGDVATQGKVIQTPPMTDLSKTSPQVTNPVSVTQLTRPQVEGSTLASGNTTGGSVDAGNYLYRFAFVNASGIESDFSAPITANVLSGQDSVALSNLPAIPAEYDTLRVYRAIDTGDPTQTPEFYRVTDLPMGTSTYTDVASAASILDPTRKLDQSRLGESHQYSYQYYITYTDALGNESIPVVIGDPYNINNGQAVLSGLPVVDPANNPDNWTGRKIYRSSGSDTTEIHLVGTLNEMTTTSFIDRMSDATLMQQPEVNQAGQGNVLINPNTLLINVGKYTNGQFVRAFETGTLTLTPQKGTQNLRTAAFEITSTTTVNDYLSFLNEAFGIQSGADIPQDQGTIGGTINGGTPGAAVMGGSFYLLSHAGTANAVSFGPTDMKLQTAAGQIKQVDLGWGQDPAHRQDATGASVQTTLQVYDSLGTPITVRVTFVLEEKNGINNETIYRWFADSSENQPVDGSAIAVGTGMIRFDQNGRLIDASNTTISVERMQVASTSPLDFEFEVNIGALMALATTSPDVRQTYQDGAGAGTLYDFTIQPNGVIMGRFTSGAERPIGQIPLATFRNQEGLYKAGDSLFLAGTNSGDAMIGIAGTNGIGSIKSNCLELSNTDMGAEIINMILASAQYRANAKVMTTSNEMFDALLRIN